MAARSGLGVTGFMNAAFGFRAVFFAAFGAAFGAAFLAPLVAVFFAAAFPVVGVFFAVLAICSPLVDCSSHVRFAAQDNTARAPLRSGNGGFAQGKCAGTHYGAGTETTNAGTWPPPDVTLARPVALRRVR